MVRPERYQRKIAILAMAVARDSEVLLCVFMYNYYSASFCLFSRDGGMMVELVTILAFLAAQLSIIAPCAILVAEELKLKERHKTCSECVRLLVCVHV